MTDFVAAVKDSSITVTCMTAEQVVHRERDLHLEDIFKEAKAIKGISDFHCFEWQNELIITKQYSCEVLRVTPNVITTSAQNTSSGGEVGAAEATTGSTASTEISHWYAVYWRNNDYWFVGRVIQKQEQLVKLEFIHQTSQNVNRFKTANHIDTVSEYVPTPVSSPRCSLLHLTDEDYNTVISSYNNCRHA